MNTAVVGLGSNINPVENIDRARKLLSQKNQIIAESPLIQTAPIGLKRQGKFLNGALLVKTELDYPTFNQCLKKIEISLGREKTFLKSGPRTIDLDIIVWNGKILHRDFHHRDFVKKSVLELIPDLKW